VSGYVVEGQWQDYARGEEYREVSFWREDPNAPGTWNLALRDSWSDNIGLHYDAPDDRPSQRILAYQYTTSTGHWQFCVAPTYRANHTSGNQTNGEGECAEFSMP
jgi:hypothetical protein